VALPEVGGTWSEPAALAEAGERFCTSCCNAWATSASWSAPGGGAPMGGGLANSPTSCATRRVKRPRLRLRLLVLLSLRPRPLSCPAFVSPVNAVKTKSTRMVLMPACETKCSVFVGTGQKRCSLQETDGKVAENAKPEIHRKASADMVLSISAVAHCGRF
jgi:hypothetical protein